MDLSLIIVSWNAENYLRKCIESAIMEPHNYSSEIIVVDNASTDGSQELVRELFPYIKLICNKDNLGFAKANNIGIKESSGEYICIINSDAEALEGCFDKMTTYMEQNPEIGMLGPQILDANKNIQRSCMGFPSLWNTFCRALALDSLFPKSKLFGSYMMTFQEHNKIQDVDIINGCFWMVRREALNQVGLLDERFFIYAEDKDWCKRFWAAGWKVVYFPLAQAIHYGGASSSNAPVRFYIEMQKANFQYWKKHHNKTSQLVYSLIMGFHHLIRLFGEIFLYIIKPSKRNSVLFRIKRSIASIQWLLGFKRISYGT